MNTEWEITPEDIKTVLDEHGISYTDDQITDWLDQLDHEEIIDNLLNYIDLEQQTESMLYDIENFFISLGIINETDKVFELPDEDFDEFDYDYDDEDDEDDEEDDDDFDDFNDDEDE